MNYDERLKKIDKEISKIVCDAGKKIRELKKLKETIEIEQMIWSW